MVIENENLRGSGLGQHPKMWDPLLILAGAEASNFKFGIQLGFGKKLTKKQLLGQKWAGLRAGSGSIQNIRNPTLCNR